MNYNIKDSFTEKCLKGGKTRILFRLSQEDKFNICSDLNAYKIAIDGKRYFIQYIDGLPRWIQFKKVWDSDVFQYIQRSLQSISYKCNYREYFGVLLESGTRISWKEMEGLCPHIEINENDKECILKQITPNYTKDINFQIDMHYDLIKGFI